MQLSQVRYGEVVHHTEKDLYARVKALVPIGGEIHLEVSIGERWHPTNCATLSVREKGETGDAYYFAPQELSLDREV